MLRELSLKAKRRVREKQSTTPQTDPAAPREQPPSKPRGLAALPRRLSRGPSTFSHRSTSHLSARPSETEHRKEERRESSVHSIIRAARRSSGGSSSRRAKKAERASAEPPSSPRVFSKKPGVTTPLLGVDELFKWRPSGAAAKCVSSVPLSESAVKRFVRGASGSHQLPPNPAARGASGSLKRLQPPRLLLCHDFKDGYQDWEACATGVSGDACPKDTEMWRFNHWSYVDIFVYFSHYCVTIPPVGYIHAAHRHGSLVLGTLIFEWDAGLTELMKILQSFKTRAKAASQLAAIAKFYGFDGWLVNVEVNLPGGSSMASDLAAFVGDLTRATRKIIGSVSEVIWYDSVTRDGSLNWQNELNTDNEQFFKAAGSIFTNYHWDRNAPVRSAVKAGTRRTDVFTGIDIHGRNTFGGGGFQTHIALRAIKQGGTSAAIFAPGWTVEKCPPNVKDPRELEERFWTGPSGRFGRECVSQYFRERPVLTELPFDTNFDPGWGPHIMRNGVMSDERRYFNMAQQQIQPSFMRTHCAGGDANAATLAVTHDKAYNGSSSIMTQFSFSESRMLTGSFSILRLFVASMVFPTRLASRLEKNGEGTVQISYDFYAEGDGNGAQAAAENFGMLLLFASPPSAVLLVGKGSHWARAVDGPRRNRREQIHGKFVNFDVCVATSERRAFGAPSPEDDATGWLTRSFIIGGSLTSGQRLAEVMVIVGAPPQQPVSVRPSPFLSPTGSRGISRLGSRLGSRRESRAGSRSNSPPPLDREKREPGDMMQRFRGLTSVPEDGIMEENSSRTFGDDFGSGLLQQYRESFGPRNRGDFPRGLRRTSDHGQLSRPFSGGFERRQESTPGVFHRPLEAPTQPTDEYGDEQNDRMQRRGSRGYQSYLRNFQIEGNVDFNEMENDDRLMSASTSRALSRLGSRFQTPSGSRLGSRYGSRYGSLAGSRVGSVAGSLAGSRAGSVAVSAAGSRSASRSASRQGSRFQSPSRTPATGGGGAIGLEKLSRDLAEQLPGGGMAPGIEDVEKTTRPSAALGELKARLMQAAGSMAGEQGGGVGKTRRVYLGGFRMEFLNAGGGATGGM